MADAIAASIVTALLGLQLDTLDQETSNRVAFDGLTVRPGGDGLLEAAIRRFELASFRLASGPFTVELGRLALQQVAATLRFEQGRPRIVSLQAAQAELAGVKARGPLQLPEGASVKQAAPWCLDPLAQANGTLRAEIVDAHLIFDANVTVPIRQGGIDFKDATVEHVGPDSRMGVSRMGFYVDAPNGRSYLYQFPSGAVAGVEFEQRGTMIGPWVKNRGKVHLQPFGESMLRQVQGAQALVGITEQARLLFDRTSLSGEVRLGDGRFCVPGMQAELAGRAEGRNVVRLHSQAVGRGVTLEIASLSVRNAQLGPLACNELAGSLTLRVVLERAQSRFEFELPTLTLSGLRLAA